MYKRVSIEVLKVFSEYFDDKYILKIPVLKTGGNFHRRCLKIPTGLIYPAGFCFLVQRHGKFRK